MEGEVTGPPGNRERREAQVQAPNLNRPGQREARAAISPHMPISPLDDLNFGHFRMDEFQKVPDVLFPTLTEDDLLRCFRSKTLRRNCAIAGDYQPMIDLGQEIARRVGSRGASYEEFRLFFNRTGEPKIEDGGTDYVVTETLFIEYLSEHSPAQARQVLAQHSAWFYGQARNTPQSFDVETLFDAWVGETPIKPSEFESLQWERMDPAARAFLETLQEFAENYAAEEQQRVPIAKDVFTHILDSGSPLNPGTQYEIKSLFRACVIYRDEESMQNLLSSVLDLEDYDETMKGEVVINDELKRLSTHSPQEYMTRIGKIVERTFNRNEATTNAVEKNNPLFFVRDASEFSPRNFMPHDSQTIADARALLNFLETAQTHEEVESFIGAHPRLASPWLTSGEVVAKIPQSLFEERLDRLPRLAHSLLVLMRANPQSTTSLANNAYSFSQTINLIYGILTTTNPAEALNLAIAVKKEHEEEKRTDDSSTNYRRDALQLIRQNIEYPYNALASTRLLKQFSDEFYRQLDTSGMHKEFVEGFVTGIAPIGFQKTVTGKMLSAMSPEEYYIHVQRELRAIASVVFLRVAEPTYFAIGTAGKVRRSLAGNQMYKEMAAAIMAGLVDRVSHGRERRQPMVGYVGEHTGHRQTNDLFGGLKEEEIFTYPFKETHIGNKHMQQAIAIMRASVMNDLICRLRLGVLSPQERLRVAKYFGIQIIPVENQADPSYREKIITLIESVQPLEYHPMAYEFNEIGWRFPRRGGVYSPPWPMENSLVNALRKSLVGRAIRSIKLRLESRKNQGEGNEGDESPEGLDGEEREGGSKKIDRPKPQEDKRKYPSAKEEERKFDDSGNPTDLLQLDLPLLDRGEIAHTVNTVRKAIYGRKPVDLASYMIDPQASRAINWDEVQLAMKEIVELLHPQEPYSLRDIDIDQLPLSAEQRKFIQVARELYGNK
jgi:hypothetical protein